MPPSSYINIFQVNLYTDKGDVAPGGAFVPQAGASRQRPQDTEPTTALSQTRIYSQPLKRQSDNETSASVCDKPPEPIISSTDQSHTSVRSICHAITLQLWDPFLTIHTDRSFVANTLVSVILAFGNLDCSLYHTVQIAPSKRNSKSA